MNTIVISFRTLDRVCVRRIVEQDVHDAVAEWILGRETAHIDKNVFFVITSSIKEAFDLSNRITGVNIVILISRKALTVATDVIVTTPEYVGKVMTRELVKLCPTRV